MEQEDILLFGANNKPLLVYDNDPMPQGSLYFNPWSYENYGKFRNSLSNNSLGNGEQEVNQSERERLVKISRKIHATMPEVNAASWQLARLTVGLGMGAIYEGQNDKWGDA